MIIVRKSPERRMAKGVGRFLTAQDEKDPHKGYSFLIFPDYNGYYPAMFTYQIIEVGGTEEPKPVTKYDLNVYDDPFTSMCFVKKPTITVVGRLKERRRVTIPLATVTFYREYLQDSVYNAVVEAKALGFNYFPSGMGSLQLDGVITLSGEFEVSLRPTTGLDGNREWSKAYKFVDGSIDVANSDLGAIMPHVKMAALTAEKERAIEVLIAELRTNGTYLDIFNARLTLRAHGVDDALLNDAEIEAALNGVTFKKDYNPEYFHALKKMQEKGTQILYSDSGFVFRIERRWVWEVPKPSTATYMFDGSKPIAELRALLSKVSRIDILKNRDMQDAIGYLGRAIHPPEDENGQGMSRWLRDVCVGTGVRHEVEM
jgi:hypothetical protein